MEPINFYKNGSPKQHKAVSRWFCLSCLLLATSILSIASLQFQQWCICSSLTAEKNRTTAELCTFDHITRHQESQKLLQIQLEKKREKIAEQSKNQKNPAELLKIIKTSLKNTMSIQALTYTEKNIEIKMMGEKTKALMQLSEMFNQHPAYTNLCITSLEFKEKNRLLATFSKY